MKISLYVLIGIVGVGAMDPERRNEAKEQIISASQPGSQPKLDDERRYVEPGWGTRPTRGGLSNDVLDAQIGAVRDRETLIAAYQNLYITVSEAAQWKAVERLTEQQIGVWRHMLSMLHTVEVSFIRSVAVTAEDATAVTSFLRMEDSVPKILLDETDDGTIIPTLSTALGQREALAFKFTQIMEDLVSRNLQTCTEWVPLVQRTPLMLMREAKDRITDNRSGIDKLIALIRSRDSWSQDIPIEARAGLATTSRKEFKLTFIRTPELALKFDDLVETLEAYPSSLEAVLNEIKDADEVTVFVRLYLHFRYISEQWAAGPANPT